MKQNGCRLSTAVFCFPTMLFIVAKHALSNGGRLKTAFGKAGAQPEWLKQAVFLAVD